MYVRLRKIYRNNIKNFEIYKKNNFQKKYLIYFFYKLLYIYIYLL